MIEGDEGLTVTAGAAVGTSPFAPVSLSIRDDDRLGDAVALTSNGRIVSFDRKQPGALLHAVTPAGLLSDEEIVGIDVRPRDGSLYALTSRARLYPIDALTGQAVRRAELSADPGDATAPFTALAGDRFGVDFNPVADRLRVVSDTGQNLRIDVETGRTFTDGAITGGAAGLTAAGYTDNFAATCRTKLYAIDATTDRLLLQDPPNDGATAAVGAGLGVDASAALLDMITDASGVTQARAAHRERRDRALLDRSRERRRLEDRPRPRALGRRGRARLRARAPRPVCDLAAAGRAVRGHRVAPPALAEPRRAGQAVHERADQRARRGR